MTKPPEGKPDVYVPIFIGDYLADTARFTTTEHGAYFLLIMDYWRCGPPPDDREVLLGITKLRGKASLRYLSNVLSKFTLVGGQWRHKRIDEELEKAANRKKIAQENGRLGGNPAFEKGKPNPYRAQKKDNPGDNPGDKQEDIPGDNPPNKLFNINISTNTKGGGSTGAPKRPPPKNFDVKFFDTENVDEVSGRCSLKNYPFVFLHQAELEHARKIWREENELSQNEWAQGVTRLNADCEIQHSKNISITDGSAFKTLIGFLLTDALAQKRLKPKPLNGNGHHPPPKKPPPQRVGDVQPVGEVLQKIITAKPEEAEHGQKS